MTDVYPALRTALAEHGLALRRGFVPAPEDAVPDAGSGRATRTLVLVGNVGSAMWRHFAPHADAGPNALDRWTVAVVEDVADRFAARAVYPFDTPPLPFQRWAMKAEGLRPSPLGVLIHPEHGLWHAYRAALLFPLAVDVPPLASPRHPCDTCAGRPCLSACPVGAFTAQGYDVPACAAHLDSADGADCRERGCRARAACPVGGAGYAPEQVRFHMRAFHRAVGQEQA